MRIASEKQQISESEERDQKTSNKMIQAVLAKKIHCLDSFAYNGILIVLFNFCNVQTLNIYNIHTYIHIYFSLFCDLKFLKPYPWLQLHGVQSMCENVCYFYIDFLEKKLKTQIDFFFIFHFCIPHWICQCLCGYLCVGAQRIPAYHHM